MKNLLFSVLFVFTMVGGYSQEYWPDTIFHFQDGNSLFVLDKFNYNCACGFKQEIEFNENVVSIFEVDTIPDMANCVCSFEILTEIEDLEVGEYMIYYYRVGKMSDTSLIYSFTYTNEVSPTISNPTISFVAGACGETVFNGIVRKKTSKEIQIHPNPVADILKVFYAGNLNLTEINLYDATGKKILTEKAYSKCVSLDLSKLMPGVYFILCKTNSESFIEKIVKI